MLPVPHHEPPHDRGRLVLEVTGPELAAPIIEELFA